MSMNILGVRYGHDSSAALIVDGQIIADVAEERFSRIKNDSSFPVRAIEYCLKLGGITAEDIDILAIPTVALQDAFPVFFDFSEVLLPAKQQGLKQALKRLILGRKSAPSIVLPLYREKWKLSAKCTVQLVEHHLAHAASAAYTSGIDIGEKVLGVTMDGCGDGTSVAVWRIQHNQIEKIVSYSGEGSLGWFYGNCTEGMRWKQSSDEWKVMGLAPYGEPKPGMLQGFHPEYKDGQLTRPHLYGSFGRWNDHGSNHYHGRDAQQLSNIFSGMRPEDFAAEVQRISEEQAFNVILPWLKRENTRHLVCSGGFFLNVKFNQNLWYSGELDTQWIYPNPGDAGLSVGAALHAYYQRNPSLQHEALKSLYFGPEFPNNEIKQLLDERSIDYSYHENIEEITAGYLNQNLAIGWFQGRMEAGPRALGNRSILMSPIDESNKDRINAKVKYREKFRPFCPSILAEAYDAYLKDAREERFMVSSFEAADGVKARIPAVIHEDNTARPQKVFAEINPRYHKLIQEFGKLSGEPVLLNTSFNIKGEPIVCTPREAIKCFYDTGLDVLVLGNYLVKKKSID